MQRDYPHSHVGSQFCSNPKPVGVRLMREPGFAAPTFDAQQSHRKIFGVPTRIPRAVCPNTGWQIHHSGEIAQSTPALNALPNRSPPEDRRALSSVSFYRRNGHHDPRPHRLGVHENGDHSQGPRHPKDLSHRRRGNSSGECQSPQRLGTDFKNAMSKVPPIPQNFLKLLGTREVPALGKVRVSVRLCPPISVSNHSEEEESSAILSLDKSNRLVILVEPKSLSNNNNDSFSNLNSAGVSAPKIFTFDQVFSKDDDQNTVVNKVIPDILQAVLGGNDGCILSYGGTSTGKTYTMIGSHANHSHLGVMPYSISWLYQAINHLINTTGVKFSVRVSAVTVDASGKTITDVLSPYAKGSETSPGALLSQGCLRFLSTVTELRASSSEAAGRYLDFALSSRDTINSRNNSSQPSSLLFSLQVYQHSLGNNERDKVVGGRSRLHLLDIGDTSGHTKGSLSLSALTSVLLAIFNGKKYLPHKNNKLTHLLQETLGSITCHASMIVHISSSPRLLQHTQATLQLASRVHRLRRKKIKGLLNSSSGGSSDGSSKIHISGSEASADSSSIDFSSSEQSADTVIYLGGGGPGDSTDGEHPPIFLSHQIRRNRSMEIPRLRSLEQLRPSSASPLLMQPRRPTSASPTPTSRSAPVVKFKPKPPPRLTPSMVHSKSSDGAILRVNQPSFFRHQPGVSHINYPTNCSPRDILLTSLTSPENAFISLNSPPEQQTNYSYKFYQEPNSMVPVCNIGSIPNGSCQMLRKFRSYRKTDLSTDNGTPLHLDLKASQKAIGNSNHKSTDNCISDEHWIDGPRISKSKIKSKPDGKQLETWIDGPSLTPTGNYGFMDDHKKSMIEQWVENQSAQLSTELEDTKAGVKGNSNSRDTKQPNNEVLEQLNHKRDHNSNEDFAIESDVDTLSEDQSAINAASEGRRLDFIEELERKNLIPAESGMTGFLDSGITGLLDSGMTGFLDFDTLKSEQSERSCQETAEGTMDDSSMDDICCQCEALAEECEEINSMLMCKEEECKRQTHNGLATVIEEPELESVYGCDYALDSVSLINNPNQTDCEDVEGFETSEQENVRSFEKKSSVTETYGRPQISIRKTADCGVQVDQEDIARAFSGTPCPSEMSSGSTNKVDDHPLRMLSQENLSCDSSFTDTSSQLGELGDVDDFASDDESRPFGLFNVMEYKRVYDELRRANFAAANINCQDLATIHEQFNVVKQNQAPEKYKVPAEDYHKSFAYPELQHRDNEKGTHFQSQVLQREKNSCAECNKNVRPEIQEKLLSKQDGNNPNKNMNGSFLSIDKWTSTEESVVRQNVDHSRKMMKEQELVLNPLSLYANLTIYEGLVPNLIVAGDQNNHNLTSTFNNLQSPQYMKDVEENDLRCDRIVPTTCSCRSGFNHCDIRKGNPSLDTGSDTGSDCHSSISEDSEYIIKSSKFSKFLCVGIGRTKVKSKSSSSNKNKKSFFKFRDKCKGNKSNKSIGQNKSSLEGQKSKNLMRSPPRVLFQNSLITHSDKLPNVWAGASTPDSGTSQLTRTEDDCKCKVCEDASPSTQVSSSDLGHPQNVSAFLEKPKVASSTSCQSPQTSQDFASTASTSSKALCHPMTTSGSLGTTQSLGESSGYESILRDSECSSFSSSQESEMDEETRKDGRIVSRGHPGKRIIPLMMIKDEKGMEKRQQRSNKGYHFRVIKRSTKRPQEKK